ncbi:MAG: glycosyl hydrolase [Gemmatimonadetes bacterium]|nr:glycosyl hydrolase [Gemmatimonadota bacterium]MDA1103064.1 glycosyl hydrolase [Gemmatimonadota bacterium]
MPSVSRTPFRACAAPRWLLAGALPVFLGVSAPALVAQEVDPALLSGLSYRFIGPDGNRIISVMGEPGEPLVMYAGAASGGLFKTDDGGVRWRPIFDDQEASSVSALAMAPSDFNQIWVGTGETFLIRPAHAMGDGIYKSTDAGATWEHMGLEDTGRIGRIRVHPTNPDIVYACALGHTYGPQPSRGVYRTQDGGDNWELVLHVSEESGCIDLAMDTGNPRFLYAAIWDIHINTWGLDSGGPDSGVWRSTDSGDTWERVSSVGRGLPLEGGQTIGKIAVEVAPSEPGRVYALTEEDAPRLYRSDNYGRTWTHVSTNHTMNERAPYYTRIGVDPENADKIYFISVRYSVSVDGGRTLVANPGNGGGDTHDIWIDPTDPKRIMVGDDVGNTNVALDGRTFRNHRLPVAQMYHVAVDNEVPYNVYGNRQDGYSYRGPSNSRTGSIPLGLWQDVGGCESGFAQPLPDDANIVWSGCYDGGLEIYDHRNKQVRNVRVWPEAGYGWAPADMKYRWHWNFPIHISPHDSDVVYVGSQYVHRTEDGGHSWQEISPDLTLNLKDHQQSSGGVAIDNLMTYDGSLVFAIAESPLEAGTIWVGTNDGQVQLTRDGGASWTNLTSNLPDLPPWGTIANVEPSRFDAGTAYVSVDLHQMGDFDPWIFKTEDYGRRWRKISDGIPTSPHSFVHVVREDPKRPGMLFAGTDNAVWMTLDDGAHWTNLRLDMPPAPVYWLVVQPDFDDLVVATYGRGFYILDDIGSLRALDGASMASHTLFDVRPTYRWQEVQGIKTESSMSTGRDPQYGADIDYFVAGDAVSRVSITIEDGAGNVVRALSGSGRPGINRVYWDLRHTAPTLPRFYTKPPGRDWVPLEQGADRVVYVWDIDLIRGQRGPLAVPGAYTARVTIAGEEFQTPIEVRKDPYSTGTLADIEAQVAFSLQMRDQISDITASIERMEHTRVQLQAAGAALARDAAASEVRAEVDRLATVATTLENRLVDVHLTGAREDSFRNPMQLFGRFSSLASDVDWKGSDFAPTVAQRQVHQVLTERLEDAKLAIQQFLDGELNLLNDRLQALGRPAIVSDGEGA